MIAGRAADLRRAFDGAFAVARVPAAEVEEDVLEVGVGEDAYALPMTGITGVFAGRQITALPGSAAGLLGIAGFRGMLVPVYDLRLLLGHPGGGTPRWLVHTAGDPSVALAFDRLVRHLRLPRPAFAASDRAGSSHIREIVRMADGALPVIDLPSLVACIGERSGRAHPSARNPQP